VHRRRPAKFLVDLLGAVGKATVYDLHWSSMGPLTNSECLRMRFGSTIAAFGETGVE
jgi:hypothetical protein